MSDYKTSESIVAFIDILGASQAIEADSEGTLNIVHRVYDETLSQFQSLFAERALSPKVRIFSDNIVIYHICPENCEKQVFYTIAMMCAIFQEKMLSNGFLVRGGISKGDFYGDSVLIWGRALVHAYNLESNIAIYPRIIVAPELIRNIELFTKPDDPLNSIYSKWLFQDYDGLVYIDYFHDFSCLANPFSIYSFLNDIEMRIANSSNLKVTQKLLWHRTYLARKLQELLSNSKVKEALEQVKGDQNTNSLTESNKGS